MSSDTFLGSDDACIAALITNCTEGTVVTPYGANRVQAAIIGDWNCDYVTSNCRCNTNSKYPKCSTEYVGYT